ncbi:protein phosphatase 2C domain-containing protein [Microbacterium sp. W1N]|uniref:PP2C family protein-serine/threonine phosphatase n=1 Tax=Microbacterium festucae TaxID=2977531 RepID=UPI0021BFB2B1|nr:protein phosphatase 2C domain-containing protein [Microbacterium festucae]MCT9820635.1 protein phosphatase 2C domain-containing protein [Microbacterium festucae]
MTAALQVTVGSHTDAGLRRAVNEDSVLARHPVFVVADGMGGHDAGDRASAAVVAAFAPLVGREVTAHEVAATVQAAHAAVAEIAATTRRGAGSTLTGVVAVHHDGLLRWLVVNIGDSRVYRLLDHRLEQLTVDHSVAQEMVDAGTLAREDMSTFSGRNVITRAVGEERSAADFWLLPVTTGERLLVCSDGLTTELTDEALRAGLTLGGTAEQTARALVAQAVAAGGRDNITVIVIDVTAGGANTSFDEVTGGLSSAESSTVEVATVQSARRRAR